jgi:hypothetical protein
VPLTTIGILDNDVTVFPILERIVGSNLLAKPLKGCFAIAAT